MVRGDCGDDVEGPWRYRGEDELLRPGYGSLRPATGRREFPSGKLHSVRPAEQTRFARVRLPFGG